MNEGYLQSGYSVTVWVLAVMLVFFTYKNLDKIPQSTRILIYCVVANLFFFGVRSIHNDLKPRDWTFLTIGFATWFARYQFLPHIDVTSLNTTEDK